MNKQYVSNALLSVNGSQVTAVLENEQRKAIMIDNPYWLSVLEIFVHERSLDTAYRRFRSTQSAPVSITRSRQRNGASKGRQKLLSRLSSDTLHILINGMTIDLTARSKETFRVLASLVETAEGCKQHSTIHSFEEFEQLVVEMVSIGLLALITGVIDWGGLAA